MRKNKKSLPVVETVGQSNQKRFYTMESPNYQNTIKSKTTLPPKAVTKKALGRLMRYILEHPGLCILALGLMLLSNLLALCGPKLSGNMIDALLPGNVNFPLVWKYGIWLIVFYVSSSILSYVVSFVMVLLSQRITYRVRKQLFDHLMTLPVSFFDTHQTGDIISRISYDIDTMNASLSNDLLQICVSVITIVGAFVMMLTISPPLILIFLITVPVSVLFTKYKTNHIRPFFRRRSAMLGALNGYAEEMLSGQKTITAYAKEDAINREFGIRNHDAAYAYYLADYHGSVVGPTVNFINNLSLSLIVAAGGILYMLTLSRPDLAPILCLTPGALSSFVQYSRKFSGPINEFANILNELQSAMSAAERVFRLIDEPSEPTDRQDALDITGKEIQGQVDFDQVNFGYTPEHPILKEISLQADPGKLIAIVGPTGAGKTTIINLLLRFYDIDSGSIHLDGMPINSLTRDSLRRQFTMVLQDTWLFSGTIYDNIAYAKPGATLEEVQHAAEQARISDFIESLPNGYDTILSDDGAGISKGQKQLLTIARAMLLETPILILDEATSNVDSRTEKLIQEAMYSLMQNRTCFVIAHRLSTIHNADTILVLQNGQIIESGSHQALLQSGGFYAKLYNSQFQ